MNGIRLTIQSFLLTFFVALPSTAQQRDTLIDVGGYQIHFSVIEGEGMPIVFEPGGTYAGPPWNGTLELIHRVTGAPIVTYDRSGFGESELDPNETEVAAFGIENGMEELEVGLAGLGFDREVILVGHSYGAFYTALFASRHPQKVRGIVMVNGQLPGYWTDERLSQQSEPKPDGITRGDYYLRSNFPQTIDILRRSEIPPHVPLIDLVAGIPIYFMSADDFSRWKQAHSDFVASRPNAQGMMVHRSGHYIFQDSPIVFVNAVVKAYANAQTDTRKLDILSRSIDLTMELANEPASEESSTSR